MTQPSQTQPEPSASFLPSLQPLRWGDPFRWLTAGARDLRAAPVSGVFYGTCFWLMAVIVAAVFRNEPEYTMSFISGCFLVGPFLAMGLYESSRRREAGLPQNLAVSLTCWERHLGSMAMLVLVLLLLELLWGRASLVIFAVFFNTGMPATTSVVDALFDPRNWQFVAIYTLVGGVFATLVYATCVVSIPMILDRDTDAITAGISSIRVVFTQPGPMLLWAALIVGLLLGAMLMPYSVGLLLVGPWLGHASWHAYRGCYGTPDAAQAA
jgi:uncharacterized membrane protein